MERESYFVLVIIAATAFLLPASQPLLARYGDRRPEVSRFHFRQHFLRATPAFLTTPETE